MKATLKSKLIGVSTKLIPADNRKLKPTYGIQEAGEIKKMFLVKKNVRLHAVKCD